MKNKVLLNGATRGTNFGDYLFAQIFQDTIKTIISEENIVWYESRFSLSPFYRRFLGYKTKKWKYSQIKCLINISGGYFCANDKCLKEYIIRFFSYFYICLICIFKKIPIVFIGIDASRSDSVLLNMIELFILKKAKLITVRNKESFDYLSNNGINDVILTTDTAHTILTTITLKKYSQILNTSNKKKLLFHYTKSYAFDIILPVLNDFLSNHPEFDVVLSTDQFYNDYSFLELEAKKIVRSNVYVYKYEDPIELCSLIKECNLIITSKLHVGIVGATYGKSIVSFPIHKEKIIRFYKQLGEDNRVLPLDLFDKNKANQILENYHNKAISIDNIILELSYKNLKFLTDYISSL